MKRPLPVAVRYAACAALATGVNLLAQWLLTGLGRAAFPDPDAALGAGAWTVSAQEAVYWTALVAGTLSGFLVKYLLDKTFIFHYTARSAGAGLAVLFLYGVTAVATTLVFWGVQRAFTLFGSEDFWKYLGGFCGLVPGYWLKYLLDKRFVFRKKRQTEGAENPCT